LRRFGSARDATSNWRSNSGVARDPADLASQALMGTLTSIALRAVRAAIRRRANPEDAAPK